MADQKWTFALGEKFELSVAPASGKTDPARCFSSEREAWEEGILHLERCERSIRSAVDNARRMARLAN